MRRSGTGYSLVLATVKLAQRKPLSETAETPQGSKVCLELKSVKNLGECHGKVPISSAR